MRKDPADVYARMDFHTRDSYRHVVEHLAQRLDRDEPAVAECVLRLAAQPGSDAPVASHVGYYLVDTGLPLLRSALRDPAAPGTPKPPRPRARRVALPVYLLPIAVIAVLWSGVLLQGVSALPPALWWITAGIALLAASELGIALVNWVATLWVRPHPLPRMDLSLGIPPDCRTLVVMPSMLVSPEAIDELVDALEVHYLANRDEQLYFALLTDFLDAAQALLPGDMALVAHAAQHIDRLNAAYADAHGDRFFLLHRARQWNAGEGCWMGAERKRGKLEALNRLLCAGDAPLQAAHEFLQVQGDVAALVQVRYVITLDSDTHLPRDAARALVGAMSHPLNVPRMDTAGQIVEAGYGILQPGLGTGMSEGGESRFARMFGIEPGIDPYTRVVSDVYQDLFGEGSFIGKGIYAVATFEQVLAGRFPDNRVLSHDLLEGCYVRAGLLSDVRLYERHPQRYATDAKRRALGAWRLAVAAMAAAVGARPRWPARAQSVVVVVARQAAGQPAPQPGGTGGVCIVADRLAVLAHSPYAGRYGCWCCGCSRVCVRRCMRWRIRPRVWGCVITRARLGWGCVSTCCAPAWCWPACRSRRGCSWRPSRARWCGCRSPSAICCSGRRPAKWSAARAAAMPNNS